MRFILVLLVMAWVTLLVDPQATQAQPADHQAVFFLLRSSEPSDVQAGLVELRAMLRIDFDRPEAERRPFNPQHHRDLIRVMRFEWLPALMQDEKFDIAAEVALAGMLGAQDPTIITHFTRMRHIALTRAGKHQEALSAAKSFYNVCGLKMTAEAVDIVAKAFERAYPDDPGIGQRFRLEQLDGADPTFKPEDGSMLSKIKVDPTPFEPAIKSIVGRGFQAHIRRGNLLLLADKPDQAMEQFETALELAELGTHMTQAQQSTAILQATEGVAKAIRAKDGLVGGSNEFLRKHTGQVPVPTPASGS